MLRHCFRYCGAFCCFCTKVCSCQVLTMMCSEATAIKIVLEKRKIIAAMLIHAKDFKRIIASISLSQQQVNQLHSAFARAQHTHKN